MTHPATPSERGAHGTPSQPADPAYRRCRDVDPRAAAQHGRRRCRPRCFGLLGRPGGVCAEPADAHADEHANARVAKGGNAKLDPNHLTAKQVKDREADLAAAQRGRAGFRTGAVAPLATVTIPVVVPSSRRTAPGPAATSPTR
ncbi:hypothetical protein V2I01_14150 [Micromonospora sp. BRA006-A]|nr:hypothetical protein [Micromonospora sp. BRA006-A]